MSIANIDPKIALALITAIKKGIDAETARAETNPGVYRDIRLDLTVEVGEMRVAPDTDKSPTSSIPLLPTLALLLKRMGVQREDALEVLRDVMQQALEMGKDATKQLLEETGVVEMEERLRQEVIAKLPRVPVKGAVTVKPEDVIVTLRGFSIGE
jgi:hypothetical protein